MTGPLVWVIGRGGFLGARLERLAPSELAGASAWAPAAARFPWTDPARLAPAPVRATVCGSVMSRFPVEASVVPSGGMVR